MGNEVPQGRVTRGVRVLRLLAAAAIIVTGLVSTSCLPGSQTAGSAPSVSTPADEVFINLLRAVEEKRADQFVAAISQSSNPDPDFLWNGLQDFMKHADQIDFTVTVNERLRKGEDIVYRFEWDRKYVSRGTQATITSRGRSEWTLSRETGRFLLQQVVGERATGNQGGFDIYLYNVND